MSGGPFSIKEVTPLDPKFYEVLSLAMRYFFTFFGVMIVWRAFSWLRKDRKATHRRLRQLPDAGTIGILSVDAGSKVLPEGHVIPVPYEGVLGFLRTCDVVVPVEDVATDTEDHQGDEARYFAMARPVTARVPQARPAAIYNPLR